MSVVRTLLQGMVVAALSGACVDLPERDFTTDGAVGGAGDDEAPQLSLTVEPDGRPAGRGRCSGSSSPATSR